MKAPSIIKYRVVTAETPADLEDAVQEAMEDEYQPIGGVSVSTNGTFCNEVCLIYAQAMGRYEE